MQETERFCGDCKACCFAAEIEGLKSTGEWCPNCDVKAALGCKVYEDRPMDCKTFRCVWLHSPGLVPASLWPKRSRVMITNLTGKGGDGFVVWEILPGAAAKKPVQRWIKAMRLLNHRVIIADPRLKMRKQVN